MSDHPISQRIRIPTRQKSQSISEIQHQQLRVSFSLLSILQPEDNTSNNQKDFKSKIPRQDKQFNRQYVPLPNNVKKLKDARSPSTKSGKKFRQDSNRQIQYLGEYFQPTKMLTPKVNSSKFYKQIGSSNKSSKKDVSTRINKSKSRCQSNQKSIKSIQNHKKMSKPFKFINRYEKSPSNFNTKIIQSPQNKRLNKNTSNQKPNNKSKSLKEILIICYQQNQQKVKNRNTFQIQKLSNKENILPKKQTERINSKSKHKKYQVSKGYTSQKLLPCLSSDYWSCGFQIVAKNKQPNSNQKKINTIKTMKQKRKCY